MHQEKKGKSSEKARKLAERSDGEKAAKNRGSRCASAP